jgi:hypothetical protein
VRPPGRDAGLETANQGHGVAPIFHLAQDGGSKQVDPGAGSEDCTKVEGVREDPDHRDRSAVETDSPADDGGIASILPFPEGIAEQGDGLAVFQRLFDGKVASENGRDAERGKEIAGYHPPRDRLRLAFPGELDIVSVATKEPASCRLLRQRGLRRSQHFGHGRGIRLPGLHLSTQLTTASGGELVKFGLAIVL